MTRRPSSSLTAFFFVLFFLAALNLPAYGQTETGTIYGSVADPTGAVVPSATIRLIDVDRGTKIEVATGNTGFYTFANVRPGHYRMEVEKSGFKLVRLTGITANVQDYLEENFKLDVGPTSEAITVIASAANVNTTDGTVSTVVDRTFADNIPLNGRTFQTLVTLTPGVVVTQTAYDDQGQFSVNGQRADANYFTVDGVSANFGVTGYFPLVQSAGGALPALSAQGGTNSLVSVDAMQEFRVQTSSFAPEYGRTPGGQISIVTRSGTNMFHGTLFEYFRNDVLDANNWFNGYTNNPPLPKAEERLNDFGGVFGGPIIKNKTFFFFSYEGSRLRQPATQETAVPDKAARQQAPAVMQPYLAAYPLPTGNELNDGTLRADFNGSYSNPSTLNAYSIRMDHMVNSKITLFGRYNYSPSNFTQRAPNEGFEPNLATTQNTSSSIQTFTLGSTQLISPRMSNAVRANYSMNRFATTLAMDNFGGASPLPDSALFPTGFSSKNGLFEMEILGVGVLLQGKFGTDEQRQINIVDNLSLVRHSHQMKVGVDYRWLSPFTSPNNYRQAAIFLGLTCPTPPCIGYTVTGTTALALTNAYQPVALLARNFSLYGQDTWKISPRLTLTYGLRWDINPPLKGKTSQDQPFTVTGLNDPATMTLAPHGTPLYDTTYGNVAPRLGIAYQLHGEGNWNTVLRGGFGIFYDLGYGSLGGVSSFFPFGAVQFASTPGTCSSGQSGICFPLNAQNAAPPTLSTSPPVSDILVADPHLKLPRTYEWNAALEQSLGQNQILSLTYVGAVGRKLLRVSNLVNPNSDFQQVDITDNTATSDYHALQIKFERRLSHGLQVLASYAWAHSIDILSTDALFNYLGTPAVVGNPHLDRGNSDFDIRHSFAGGVTYNLPSPGWNNITRAVLRGWSADAFIFARTAPPVDITSGFVYSNGIALYPRPNVVPGQPLELYSSQYPGGKIFNSAAFSAPVTGEQGDFPRNFLRAFGATQADIAFQRQFRLTERMSLRFRGEFFNIFNHPNFGPPDNQLTDRQCMPPAQPVGFGCSTQTLAGSLAGTDGAGLNPLYQIGGPRSIQLALKLQF